MDNRDGWKRVRFGDVVENVNVTVRDLDREGISRIVGLEHLDPGELAITRWGSTDEGTTFTRRFTAGQVLFGKRRAYQRKVGVPEFDGVCSGDIYVFQVKDGQLLEDLLPFIVQSDPFFDHALRTSAGSLSPRTNWRDLKDFEFELPSLTQQRELAANLRAVERVLVKIRAALNSLVRANVALSESFSRERTVKVVELKTIAEIRSGIAKGKRYPPGTALTEVPYLRVANVQDRFLDLTEVKTIRIPSPDVVRYALERGDVLLTEGGDLDKLGRGAVWRDELETCVHQNHVFVVRTDRSKLIPEYLSLLTGSAYGRRYFLQCAKRTSNLASINMRQVGAFPVRLASAHDQELLIAKLRQCEEAARSLEHEARSAREVKSAMLSELMSFDVH